MKIFVQHVHVNLPSMTTVYSVYIRLCMHVPLPVCLSVCVYPCIGTSLRMYSKFFCFVSSSVHAQMFACMYDAGLPHTPSPPSPHPMVSPLACQVGSCLVWPCCFPRLVLFGLVPSPPVEWGRWSVWLAPPRLWGAVCSTEVWYGCCRLLVVMSSLHALSPHPPVALHRPPSLWIAWVRSGCAAPLKAGARGCGGGGRDPTAHTRMKQIMFSVCMCTCSLYS